MSIPCKPQKDSSRFNLYHHYKNTARTERELLTSDKFVFTEDLDKVYSLAMMNNNVYLLTETQQRVFTEYLTQADSGLTTEELKQLDAYLGSV